MEHKSANTDNSCLVGTNNDQLKQWPMFPARWAWHNTEVIFTSNTCFFSYK